MLGCLQISCEDDPHSVFLEDQARMVDPLVHLLDDQQASHHAVGSAGAATECDENAGYDLNDQTFSYDFSHFDEERGCDEIVSESYTILPVFPPNLTDSDNFESSTTPFDIEAEIMLGIQSSATSEISPWWAVAPKARQ